MLFKIQKVHSYCETCSCEGAHKAKADLLNFKLRLHSVTVSKIFLFESYDCNNLVQAFKMDKALVEKVEKKMEEITHQEASLEERTSGSELAKPNGQNNKYEGDTVDIDNVLNICVLLVIPPGVVWTI